MRVFFTLILSFIIFASSVNAADYEFVVTHSKGNKSQYKVNGKKTWRTLKVGTKLHSRDQILIKSGSYIGLRHKSGKVEVLTKPMTYSVAKLSSTVAKRKSKTSEQFASYFLSEVGSADDRLSQSNHRKRMGTGGHVDRAVGDKNENVAGSATNMMGIKTDPAILKMANQFIASEGNNLVARLPRTSYIVTDNVEFSWYKHPEIIDYTLKITDKTGNVLLQKSVKDTTVNVNLKELNLVKGNNYYWTVSAGDYSSDEFYFNYLSDNKMKNLNADIEAVSAEIDPENNPIGLLVLASIYEEHNVMPKAIEYYQKAIDVSGGNEDFKQLYAQYLYRIGLANEASAYLWAQK